MSPMHPHLSAVKTLLAVPSKTP